MPAMTRTLTRTLAVRALWLALALVAVSCKKKDENAAVQPPTTTATTPAPSPAALRVTDIELGRRIGSDKHVSDKTDSFGVRDTIYASVITDGAAPSAKLTARWTYQGKQVITETNQTIAPTGGTTATEFHIQKPSGWPKGKYKVEVLLDNVVAGSKDFTVK